MFKPTPEETSQIQTAIEAWDIFELSGRPLAMLRKVAIDYLCAGCDNIHQTLETIDWATGHSREYPLPVDINHYIDILKPVCPACNGTQIVNNRFCTVCTGRSYRPQGKGERNPCSN